jgi:hypothetical protein
VSSSGQLCSAAVTGSSLVSVSPTAFSVATGGTTSLTLTLDGGKAGTSTSGDYSGDVAIACGSTTLRVPWFVRITRQGKP